MAIYEFEGKKPSIGRGSFIHPEATIIGDVTLGEGCYVGPGARIRGDWGRIIIGRESNIQENCIIHAKIGATGQMGDRSHIGHGAILHTPMFGEHVMIGMGAIVLDFVEIGDGCLIGAGSVVTEKTIIPPFKLVLGIPAKVVGDISDERADALEELTKPYIVLPSRCHEGLKEIKLEDCIK